MPGPRYVNELQENAVWLCLAAFWSIGGLVAWLTALGSQAVWIGSTSGLSLLAVLATGICVALRLPILSSPPSTTLRSDHGVWLLSTFASVNWLGFFLLQSPQWPDALCVAMIWLVGETWFYVTAWRLDGLPWLRECLSYIAARLAGLGIDSDVRPSTAPNAESSLARTESDGSDARDTSHVADPQPADEQVRRRMVDGVDEQGRRYLSGEIRVAMGADQRSETIVVSFSPPFAGAPEVDFDCETEGVDVQLVNLTPTGMRLGIRRSSAAEPTVFSLPWYAAEVELEDVSASAIDSRVLP